MKKILLPSLAVVVVAIAAGLGLTTRTAPGLPGPVANDAAMVTRGAYVARLADCAACHTAINGPAFGGGLQIASPIGTIYSTNITPDAAHGIGRYSLADFDRAVRQGVRKDGASLYPAMPYPSFASMSDDDIKSLYAYFMHGVAPVDKANTDAAIPWPLSMRWPLAVWRGVFAPKVGALAAPPGGDASVRRGAYLVEGPGHCGACHTPRGAAMQETALSNTLGPTFLAGGTVIDGWVVPSLRGDDIKGLGRWSEADIVTFLKTGRIEHAAVFGGMTDVVSWSTRHFSDDDLTAIARYLKTLPAGETGRYAYDPAATAVLDGGKVAGNNGARVYVEQCAICHRTDGGGIARMFPPLAGNPVVVSDNPASLLHIVATGAALPPSNLAPSSIAMPGYTDRLSDQDIADVVNFIRTSWGNHGMANATATMAASWRHTSTAARDADTSGWPLATPQPYGDGWNFSPQSHTGHDQAQ